MPVLWGERFGSVTASVAARSRILFKQSPRPARAYAQRGGRSVSRSVFCRGRTEEVEGSPFELSCGDDHFRICCSARFLGLLFRASRPRRAVCGVRNRELDLCLCGVSVRFYALKRFRYVPRLCDSVHGCVCGSALRVRPHVHYVCGHTVFSLSAIKDRRCEA